MELLWTAVKDGSFKAIKTMILLLKVVLPVYAIVVVIRYSPIMTWLQDSMTPTMKFFGLPAVAVVPLVTGFFTDEYSVIAAIHQFDFTSAQITTIAMMGMVAHGLPVEAAIIQRIGLNPVKFTAYRLVSSILIGLLIGWMGGIFQW